MGSLTDICNDSPSCNCQILVDVVCMQVFHIAARPSQE